LGGHTQDVRLIGSSPSQRKIAFILSLLHFSDFMSLTALPFAFKAAFISSLIGSLTWAEPVLAESAMTTRSEFSQAGQAGQTALDRLRLCPLHNLSGYSAIDAAGNLINLSQYCQSQQQMAQSNHAPFWQAFLTAADPKAIAYARTLNHEAVFAYGEAICPFLESGGTVGQLRQIQTAGTLPSGFEVAITIAAIQTHCPTYQSEFGRSEFGR
jgi:hypothetical protein